MLLSTWQDEFWIGEDKFWFLLQIFFIFSQLKLEQKMTILA